MSFFTIFTVVKILAKFGTTSKMLNDSLLWSCGGCFFEFLRIVWFLWCLSAWTCVKLSLLQVRVLTMEFSAAIFIELLKFFCEVLTNIFRMHAYVWWRIRGIISREEGGLPYPFMKIEKILQTIWKNALIVFIHRLNVHLCSNLKCHFKST